MDKNEMEILNAKEKRNLDEKLEEKYGVRVLEDFVVLKTGRRKKLWVTNREVFKIPFSEVKVNSMGLYFGRITDRGIKPSIEGSQIIGETAEKNVVEVGEKGMWNFVRGFKVKKFEEKYKCEEGSYVIVKHKEDILGMAKLVSDGLKSVIPKGRKITSI